jgi:hypothetical protein
MMDNVQKHNNCSIYFDNYLFVEYKKKWGLRNICI